MDLLHRKAQSYKFSNKNGLFCAWRDFNKTFYGISTYHKWMFKLQISSIYNFDQAHQSWISGVLCVKLFCQKKNHDFITIWFHCLNLLSREVSKSKKEQKNLWRCLWMFPWLNAGWWCGWKRKSLVTPYLPRI